MAYCTIAQLTERYGARMLQQLSDRGEDAPVVPEIDEALFDRAIADADAAIDGALNAARYKLPLTAVPRLLTDLSLTIAIYKAHGQVVADKIRDDYRDAMKSLAQIGAGTIRLDIDGVEPAGSNAGGVVTNEPDRPFSADTMKGYI